MILTKPVHTIVLGEPDAVVALRAPLAVRQFVAPDLDDQAFTVGGVIDNIAAVAKLVRLADAVVIVESHQADRMAVAAAAVAVAAGIATALVTRGAVRLVDETDWRLAAVPWIDDADACAALITRALHPMIVRGRNDHHHAALVRRARHLATRVDSAGHTGLSYDKAELAALTWALSRLGDDVEAKRDG